MKRAIGFICAFSFLIVIGLLIYDQLYQPYRMNVDISDIFNMIILVAIPAGIGLHVRLKNRTERAREQFEAALRKTETKSLKDQF
jgi:hypothetical protein